MKKINKFLALLASAGMFFVSCSDLASNGSESTSTSSKNSFLSVSFDEDSRTIVPEYSLADFTKFKLECNTSSGGVVELTNASGVKAKDGITKEQLTSSRWTGVSVGDYTFKLTAERTVYHAGSDVVLDTFVGTATQAITAGENSLKFSLTAKDLVQNESTANSDFSVTLYFPSAVGVAGVKAGYAPLGTTDLTDASNFKDLSTLTINQNAKTEGIVYSSAVYTKEMVKSGAYILQFKLYKDSACTALLNTYTEVIILAEKGGRIKNTTDNKVVPYSVVAERYLTSFNGYYSITYDYMGGATKPSTPSKVYPTAYTKDNITNNPKIEIPQAADMVRLGYRFDGWYLKYDSATKAYSDSVITYSAGVATAGTYGDIDADGKQTLKLQSPIAGENLTLYAKWTAISYKVTYTTAQGTTPAADAISLDMADPLILPVLAIDDFIFDGWFKDDTSLTTISAADLQTLLANDATLAAVTTDGETAYALTAKWRGLDDIKKAKVTEIGDIVVKDGTNAIVLPYTPGLKLSSSKEIIGVAFYIGNDSSQNEKALGNRTLLVAPKNSTGESTKPVFSWTKDESVDGYTAFIDDLEIKEASLTTNLTGKYYNLKIKNGDLTKQGAYEASIYYGSDTGVRFDGCKALEKFKEVARDYPASPASTEDARMGATYPAWEYVDGEMPHTNITGIAGTKYYLPSVAELYELSLNKTVVNQSLKLVNAHELEATKYWSSSTTNLNDYAWSVDFSDNTAGFRNVYHYNETLQFNNKQAMLAVCAIVEYTDR